MLSHVTVKPDERRLEELLVTVRKRGVRKTYDCVAALSGGRDSTVMLHQLVTKHRLRCVAFFGRTLFTPPDITANARRITEQLGVKLVEFTVPFDLHRRIAAFSLLNWVKTKESILCNLACAPCKLVNREIFRWARDNDVRAIIYGGNRYEYFPKSSASIDLHTANRYSLRSMFIDNLSRIFKGVRFVLELPSLVRHLPTFIKASLLYVNQYTVFLRIRYPDILRFDYFHYADWDESQVDQILKKLNWQLPPDCASTWRADCSFADVKNRIFREHLGYTYTEAFYSNLIRAGKISRESALDRVNREPISEARLKSALQLIGLPQLFERSGSHAL